MNSPDSSNQNTAPPQQARSCWVQGRRIYLEIDADRSMSFPASQFAALETAPQFDLEKVHLNDSGTSMMWDSLDKEVSVEEVTASRFS